MNYYKLRNNVVELFYETQMDESYTAGQAAGRGMVEFQRELTEGGRAGLVVMSVILSRVARHDAGALAGFAPEIERLVEWQNAAANWAGWEAGAKERMVEDVRFTLERAGYRRMVVPGIS